VVRFRKEGRLRPARPGKRLILLYHRIVSLDSDPLSLAVSPANFEEHLRVLGRFQVARLHEILEPTVEVRVAITFDDGYADNLTSAEPLLRAHASPATIFVVSGAVGSGREFWWDRLERLCFQGAVDARVDETEEYPFIDLRGEDSRIASFWRVNDFMIQRHPNRIERVLAQLERKVGIYAEARSSHLPLSVEELQKLAASPVIDIGAHSVSHPRLSILAKSEQEREISSSKNMLETMTRMPVRSFSYPYGSRDAFSRFSMSVARRSGYELACANIPGSVRERSSQFRLNRFLVRNWTGDEFLGRIRQWAGVIP